MDPDSPLEHVERRALVAALRSVPCLYAFIADIRVFTSPGILSFQDEVSWGTYFSGLVSFLQGLPETADVAAAELPVPPIAPPDSLLARTVHTVFRELTIRTCGCPTPLYRGIEHLSWEFQLFGREFFPLVLSPGYPRHHPRYLCWRQPVLLFQPEESFTRHGISSDSAARSLVSELSEAAFLRSGRRYCDMGPAATVAPCRRPCVRQETGSRIVVP